MLPLPLMIAHGQPLEIPAPFGYDPLRRDNRNQPKGTHFAQRQLRYTVCDLVSAGFSGQFPNDLSTANGIMLRLTRDAVPIY